MSQVPIEDPSIKLRPTAKLIEVIVTKVVIKSDTSEGIITLKNASKAKRGSCLLSLKDIKWLNEYLKEHRKKSKEKIHIHELLIGADVILPEPKIIPRNPKLEARVKKLRDQQNTRAYLAMTKGIDSFRAKLPEDTIAFQMKEINKQLIAVLQFVISVMAAFLFGFLGLDLIYSNLDFGFRLLLGVICALTVALAEIYFLAKKLSEDYPSYEMLTKSSTDKVHQD